MWFHWMLAASRAQGLCILNFMITSNHIHLLIHDLGNAGDKPIARALQLAEARVAQEYNKRKARSGAFWEDRYHATAVQTGEHFINCLTYVDLNMVRANVVTHPAQWRFCGYHELQRPRQRHRNILVDLEALGSLLKLGSVQELREARADWVADQCRKGPLIRDPLWTESVAVGGEEFIDAIKSKLGGRAKGRDIERLDDEFVLREEDKPYLRVFRAKNDDLVY